MSISALSSSSNKTKTFIWDQHASDISKKLQTFYQEKLFFDIVLISKIDNSKVHAHRNVLSAVSTFFLAMFRSPMMEATSREIELAVDGATLILIIDFMYSGTLELSCGNCESLLKAAGFFQMNTLITACCDFLVEHTEATNCLGIAVMAEQYHFTELYDIAIAFALKHFDEVCLEEEFLQLSDEQLRKLISSDDLCVQSEEAVFQNLVAWLEYDKANRYKDILELLSLVRFSFLSADFIKDNRHLVSGCNELMCSWLETRLSTNHCKRSRPNGKQTQKLAFISGFWTDEMKLQTFDAELNTWSVEEIPRPPMERSYFRPIVINQKLIIAGGRFDAHEPKTVECLDLETKEWANLSPMRMGRDLPGIAELNGHLYVVGGRINGTWSQSMEKYDFCTREWREMAPLHSSFKFLRVAVVGEHLYAVGDGSSPIECYNPISNEWNQIAFKNEKSLCFGIAGVGGYLYAVGGEYNDEASKTVERYSPSTDTWTVISPGLSLGLYSVICASWNDRLVACRGVTQEGRGNLVEEYNPETNEWTTLASLLPHYLDSSSSSLFTI